jgi:fused signal recognition particle receptor
MPAPSFSALAFPAVLGLQPVLLLALAGVLGLLVLGALLLRARHKPKAAESLPAPGPLGGPPLPESEAQRQRRAEAQEARERASRLAEERGERAAAARRSSDASERASLEAEARALKSSEEEAKRAAYRAEKAAEQAARAHKASAEADARREQAHTEERMRVESARQALAETEAQAARVQAEGGRTLAAGLERTRSQGFVARLNHVLGAGRTVDAAVLAELEEVLFTADIGVQTAAKLVDLAREHAKRSELGDAARVKALIETEVARLLALPSPRSLEGGGPPHVVMVVGVNGAGKTTTIGKLAARLTRGGKRVVLAAGDTFRAAATEQLDIWAERAQAQLVRGAEDSDPAAVVYEAVKQALSSGADVVLADTAGRLHTKAPLMEELQKVKRVLGKALPGAPHEVLLVLDATVGQNAIAQAKRFHEAVGVTSIVLTKLDGTAKGGVIIGIADELKLPVSWVGVGEKVTDLRPFSASEFVEALFAVSAPLPRG